QTESWRREAIATSVDRLDAHWTDVALACCRANQPLALGVEPLRLAHQRLIGELDHLDASVPVDREAERRTARTRLAEAVAGRRSAERELVGATERHDRLSTQRWPRRDSHAIGTAADRLHQARDRLDRAHEAETGARALLEALDAHQQDRRRALNETTFERRHLTGDVGLIDDALDRTRPQRVTDALDRPAPWHTDLLGPPPRTSAGRAVWCEAACRLEAHLDAHGHDGPGWTDLCHDLAPTPELCAVADRYLDLDAPTDPHHWAYIVERARQVRDELFIDRRQPAQPNHDEPSIGLDIGW
ncbi:MAG TPA: hypothetical protein VKD67_04140, partial [Acidimicrobiales bacterium]|nr:hypothetical protein [Acidimicrobiales bacterium]